MDIKIIPGKLSGTVTAIPSKSQAHRLLICAAFSDATTTLLCPDINQDIEATADCLNAIGATVTRTSTGYTVTPVKVSPVSAVLNCRESGSTLRFMLPIVCALGIKATITMSGRLPKRPLSPLWEELERMGCTLSRPTADAIQTDGKLRAGIYIIDGSISSQFITGLLFALSLLDGKSQIHVTGRLESKPYVEMTQKALAEFGVQSENFCVTGSVPFHSPRVVHVEGDWSNAAFFLAAKAMGSDIFIENISQDSPQGDRVIADLLAIKDEIPVISVADIPDLTPILAVFFATKKGAVFTDIARLRLKESDRIQAVTDMLHALGVECTCDEKTLRVFGGTFTGGVVDACSDHRIAMAAGIAATVSKEPVVITGAECVAKSYPTFWQEYERLGGKYEQYIR